jgi:hypothetical protein
MPWIMWVAGIPSHRGKKIKEVIMKYVKPRVVGSGNVHPC